MAIDLPVNTSIRGAGTARVGHRRMATALALACLAVSPTVRAGEVFRCTVDGKVIYADHPCAGTDSHPVDVVVSQGYAPVPPTVEPVPGAPAPGVPGTPMTATNNNAAKLPRAEPGEGLGYVTPAPVPAEDKKPQCKALEKQLQRNESAARQRNSAAAMDTLREDKRRIQDEQHELGC